MYKIRFINKAGEVRGNYGIYRHKKDAVYVYNMLSENHPEMHFDLVEQNDGVTNVIEVNNG